MREKNTKPAVIEFEISKQLGVLSTKEDSKGVWTKELNIVSWNNFKSKYDIRFWNENHEKMKRGITLYRDEMNNIVKCYVPLQEAPENGESEVRGDSEFSYQVLSRLGCIKAYETGWTKELNIIKWNNGEAVYDIRDWSEDKSRMSRGMTLTPDEIEKVISFYLKEK